MIIACYAGVGKTYFAEYVPNSLELVSMPHTWILPGTYREGEHESIKGALFLLKNPVFPWNYIAEILKAEEKYNFAFGGSYSVDKFYRLERRYRWFDNE